ncbi:Glycosyl transferase family protein [Candidatus Sulfotelmatomonas gaucii]|uniref:Glycosyl transferase family protein n=1 Tax=Candidatus Sulfuritelmatomonas gaucii TaxID=2043161 RepID=A0A2N9LYV8_9BACT|nr:Glycosyl transferase family protein [Candidatus Sulfotelmatomonas gaucii]
MSSTIAQEPSYVVHRRTDTAILLGIAAAVALIHLLTNNRYGFHRDELQFLSDARHLDWGFVAYPPLTPFLERILLSIFGVSMVGLRLSAALAQAVVAILGGLMARELGGSRLAQVIAALAVAFSPVPVFEGHEFQYTSFDLLWWVLAAYFVIRLLKSEDPRWCLAIGAVIGLGLETKYSIAFFVAGIVAGLLFTPARRYLKSGWFWAGAALAFLIFLPNFIWLARHNWISYTFLQHIHARDVGEGRANGFLKGQFIICANLAATPLWLAGLFGYLLNRRYRTLAFMYLVPLVILFIAKGRHYYMAPAYPMLLAMGALLAERWLGCLPRWGRITVETFYFSVFALISAFVCALLLPLASSGPLKDYALSHSYDLREEIGWNQLVRTVAQIRDSLSPDQQAHLGIATGNYGEYGAIDVLGRAYSLPEPIGTTNSEWYRGYPTPPPTTIIVLGNSRERADELFTNCRLAGHNGNSEGVRNEESVDHPDIFVCGPPRKPWPQIWKGHQDFG